MSRETKATESKYAVLTSRDVLPAVIARGDKTICMDVLDEQHAALIVEALEVVDETGLTPRELADRVKLLEEGALKQQYEICQTLGKALGYSWYRDDQKNFPSATEENGVCTGEHVAESIAVSAANRIKLLEGERAEVIAALKAYRAAELMSTFAPFVELSERKHTYEEGSGNCSKYGRWYGVCHSCNREREELQARENVNASRKRDDALRAASSTARALITKLEGTQGK